MSKVYHFNEIESFYGSDEWKLEINVSDLWTSFTNKEIDTPTFNQKYALRLNEFKSEILELGVDVWNEIVPHINSISKATDDDSSDLYDQIYDWADKNDILIKTK